MYWKHWTTGTYFSVLLGGIVAVRPQPLRQSADQLFADALPIPQHLFDPHRVLGRVRRVPGDLCQFVMKILMMFAPYWIPEGTRENACPRTT